MNGPGARRDRYGMPAASPIPSRRHQAGDYFSQRETNAASWDYETLGQEASASSSEQPQEQHVDAYTMIPPNPSKRNLLQKIANKELEDLAKWKEMHRPGLITLTPQKLGGRISEAEVRQKQQLQHYQSKFQQKLKKEEYERMRRVAEEADILKKKMIQREKANKLEEKQRQQELRRQQLFDEDHYLKNTDFLNRLDINSSTRTPCQMEHYNFQTAQTKSQSYKQIQRQEEDRQLQEMKEKQRRKAEMLEFKRSQEERIRMKAHQNEQQRVNNEFLDRLQNNSRPGGIYQSGCLGNMDFSADSWDSTCFH